ncbi:MAG: stage III sporulation protein AF [Oscillibacter sp.]|jgi:stage III sporulation protein AF|nr:stage III sporulation protein AF [Oscillibacter sp.]
MMEKVRVWLTAVVAVSILITLAQSLIPEGTLRKIASMTGGLLLLIVLLLPVKGLDVGDLKLDYGDYEEKIAARQEELQSDTQEELSKLIAEKTEAYIKDEAAALGIDCTPVVTTKNDADGTPCPYSVELDCALDARLQEDLSKNLGIPKERQVYHGTGKSG